VVAADPRAVRRAHLAAALVAAVVTAGVLVATWWDRPGVLVAVAVLQTLLVPAWVYGIALPGRIGGTLIGLGAAAAADAALVVRDRVSLLALLGVLGLVLPALVLHQLTRGVVRVRVTESLAGIAMLITAVVALSVLVALARAVDGPRLVAALAVGAGAGLAVARVVDAVAPAPRLADDVAHGLPAVLAAGLAGAAGGALLAGGARQLDAAGGALLGAVVAVLAALVAVGIGFVAATTPERRRATSPALAYLGVAVPLALAAPVGYLVSLAVAG
jgi:hypothetical protein